MHEFNIKCTQCGGVQTAKWQEQDKCGRTCKYPNTDTEVCGRCIAQLRADEERRKRALRERNGRGPPWPTQLSRHVLNVIKLTQLFVQNVVQIVKMLKSITLCVMIVNYGNQWNVRKRYNFRNLTGYQNNDRSVQKMRQDLGMRMRSLRSHQCLLLQKTNYSMQGVRGWTRAEEQRGRSKEREIH